MNTEFTLEKRLFSRAYDLSKAAFHCHEKLMNEHITKETLDGVEAWTEYDIAIGKAVVLYELIQDSDLLDDFDDYIDQVVDDTDEEKSNAMSIF